jgi:branched-chain amino acid transport system ATP-binding protein
MLIFKDVLAGYEGSEVLHGISLEVQQGEVVCIVGPNGAGKTTTLRTILGVVKPKSGKIEFMGQDITGAKPARGVEIGIAMVPEGRRIFPSLTAMENLRVGAFSHWNRVKMKENLDEIFQLFPVLWRCRNRAGSSLSGGEQQMLAIGRALMSSPKLLLLDEPSMGLAPILVEQIFDKLEQFKQRGVALLMVEQNATVALEFADRGYVMESGNIIMQGRAVELLENEEVQQAYLGI